MDRRRFCLEMLSTGAAFGGLASFAVAAPPSTGSATKPIQWNNSLKAAHKLAIEQDKPLLIVFGASWCTYCHKLEREALSDKRITTVVERDFIPVHLDFDRDSKIAKVLEVEQLPCTVILTPQADLLLKHEGYMEYKECRQTLQKSLDKRAEIQQVRNTDVTR